MFKLVLNGGPFNGGERYYSSYGVAILEAIKYYKRVYLNTCEVAYCEIFRVMPDGRLLLKCSIG